MKTYQIWRIDYGFDENGDIMYEYYSVLMNIDNDQDLAWRVFKRAAKWWGKDRVKMHEVEWGGLPEDFFSAGRDRPVPHPDWAEVEDSSIEGPVLATIYTCRSPRTIFPEGMKFGVNLPW